MTSDDLSTIKACIDVLSEGRVDTRYNKAIEVLKSRKGDNHNTPLKELCVKIYDLVESVKTSIEKNTYGKLPTPATLENLIQALNLELARKADIKDKLENTQQELGRKHEQVVLLGEFRVATLKAVHELSMVTVTAPATFLTIGEMDEDAVKNENDFIVAYFALLKDYVNRLHSREGGLNTIEKANHIATLQKQPGGFDAFVRFFSDSNGNVKSVESQVNDLTESASELKLLRMDADVDVDVGANGLRTKRKKVLMALGKCIIYIVQTIFFGIIMEYLELPPEDKIQVYPVHLTDLVNATNATDLVNATASAATAATVSNVLNAVNKTNQTTPFLEGLWQKAGENIQNPNIRQLVNRLGVLKILEVGLGRVFTPRMLRLQRAGAKMHGDEVENWYIGAELSDEFGNVLEPLPQDTKQLNIELILKLKEITSELEKSFF